MNFQDIFNCIFKLSYKNERVTVTAVEAPRVVSQAGDFMQTGLGGRSASEQPTVWSIPFTLLIVTIVVATADMLLPFIPLNQSLGTWMWIISTLITTIMTSLITEIISGDDKRALFSIVVGALVFSLIYKDLSGIFQSSIVQALQGAIPYPFIGSVVYASTHTIIPGALAGVILGGVFGSLPGIDIPDFTRGSAKVQQITLPEPPVGYEKICGRCGRNMPFDSEFCAFCGDVLSKQLAPPIVYCRFCGSKIQFRGQFCPSCGKEVEPLFQPSVYISR